MRLRVGREDDRAVHLRQLGQPLRAERGVEQEPARADVEHLGPVADDDERAHLRLEHAVEALAQRGAWGDGSEGVDQVGAATRYHGVIVLVRPCSRCRRHRDRVVGEGDTEAHEVERAGERGSSQVRDAARIGRGLGNDELIEAEPGALRPAAAASGRPGAARRRGRSRRERRGRWGAPDPAPPTRWRVRSRGRCRAR